MPIISVLTVITGASLASGDLVDVVDVSDPTMAATGTNKKITIAELLIGLQALPLAGGTMTGTLSAKDITIPSKTNVVSVGTYGTISETGGGLGYITGNSIKSDPAVDNQLIKTSGDNGHFVRMRYDQGISFHTILTGAIGTTYADNANQDFRIYGGLFKIGTAEDIGFSRNAVGVFEFNNGTAGAYAAAVAKEFRFAAPTSANGQYLAALSLTELTTIAAAATTDTTIQLPAGAIILGVSIRVTTAIPTATTFTVGDSGSAARFSTVAISTAANTTDAGTKAGAYFNAGALSVRITPNLTPANNAGRVRVTIHYLAMICPTS